MGEAATTEVVLVLTDAALVALDARDPEAAPTTIDAENTLAVEEEAQALEIIAEIENIDLEVLVERDQDLLTVHVRLQRNLSHEIEIAEVERISLCLNLAPDLLPNLLRMKRRMKTWI